MLESENHSHLRQSVECYDKVTMNIQVVIPAKAGIQGLIPAYAGMTRMGGITMT